VIFHDQDNTLAGSEASNAIVPGHDFEFQSVNIECRRSLLEVWAEVDGTNFIIASRNREVPAQHLDGMLVSAGLFHLHDMCEQLPRGARWCVERRRQTITSTSRIPASDATAIKRIRRRVIRFMDKPVLPSRSVVLLGLPQHVTRAEFLGTGRPGCRELLNRD